MEGEGGGSTLGPVKQHAELLSLTQWDLFQRFDGIRIVRGLRDDPVQIYFEEIEF